MAFDVITPAKLGHGEIAVSPALTVFYTVPPSTRTFLKNIDIANTSVSQLSATVYLVPSGGIAGSDNILLPTVKIKPNMIMQWAGVQILNEGDTIQASASALGATINISGGEAA